MMDRHAVRGMAGGIVLLALAATGVADPHYMPVPQSVLSQVLGGKTPQRMSADGRITANAVVEEMASEPGAVERLRGQLAATKDAEVRPWIQAALVRALYRSGRRAEAWQARIDSIEESASPAVVIELGFGNQGIERAQAQEIWNYVEAKVKSPAIGVGSPFEYDMEKNELRRYMGPSEQSLTEGDIAWLAKRLAGKEPSKWTPDEAVGAHFIFCLSESPERDAHVAALVNLGLKHDELAEKVLWMVTLLKGDNGAAWPLIVKYLPESFGKPATTRDIAARDALIAIHSRPRDVVALAQRTTDDHVLIATMKAIQGTQQVPAEVKEAVIGLEGRMEKFDSDYTQYLEMVAGWGAKELAALRGWMEKRPTWAMRIGAVMAEHGDMAAVGQAVVVYNSTKAPMDVWSVERRELSMAVQILSRSTNPDVWKHLNYRADLPRHDNERLLQFVRRQPLPEAQPLCDAFDRQYKQANEPGKN